MGASKKVKVAGTFRRYDGTPAKGTVRFTIPMLSNPDAKKIQIPRSFIATLDSEGGFSIDLPARDDELFDGYRPDTWDYRCTPPGNGEPFDLALPSSLGSIDLSSPAESLPTPPPPPPDPGPPPTPGDPGSWDAIKAVGLAVETTHQHSGGNISDPGDLPDWTTGAGTADDPWVINRTDFAGNVHVTSWGSLRGRDRVLKFVNCRFRGNPGNPTPDGSHCLQVDNGALARVIVADSTLGPSGPLLDSGGPDPRGGGVDKVFISWAPFELLRCNLYGGCIGAYFELEPDEGSQAQRSTIKQSYIHDTWSSPGDHTDLINGNFHASHILVQDVYLDGIRSGNSRCANGIGIYNDPEGVVISDWILDHVYIDRCATGILCTDDRELFRDPFEVTDVTFARNNNHFAGRSPSQQSGNTTLDGQPITL